MCGIVGFTGQIDSKKLDSMLSLIEHRGPDGEGTLKKPSFSFGMRRLSIIDPNGGWQPIWNEDKTIAIVFNGEIYNYQSLWKELESKGHIFETDHSDTETIVHAYEEWGNEFVNKLRGMFALAIWDSNNKKLIIARDRLGIKPLYYSIFNERIIFASEIKAITKTWEVDRSPDDSSVYKYLMYRLHDNDENTFFKSVKKLLPGHLMEINLSTDKPDFKITKYWNPQTNSQFKGAKKDSEYISEFREKFIETVKTHLVSDAPLGAALSGGLDSSGITSVAFKLRNEGVNTHTDSLMTFSSVYPGQSIDESEYIKEVINYTDAKMVTTVPTVDKFWNEINEWIYYQEEPTISSAPYAYYSVYRLAKEHVKVMLSGNGGDELLAGYIPYFQSYLTSAIDQGYKIDVFREIFRGIDLYYPYIKQKLRSKFSSNEISISSMLNSSFYNEYKEIKQFNFENNRNLNERLLQDVTFSSIPNLTRYDDKNSMAFSIESRPPFLDHELVEFIFSLPIDMKIKNGWNRYVYREAMKGLMPEKNRKRRSKIGFTNPEMSWLNAKVERYFEIFNSDSFRSRKYWDADEVLKAFDKVLKGGSGDILMFWRLMNTELWMRVYCD